MSAIRGSSERPLGGTIKPLENLNQEGASMCVSTLGSRRHRLAVAWRVVCVSVIVIVALAATSNAQESALVFDGIDDLATIESPIGWPSATSALTVEAWVKPSDVSGTSMNGIVVNDGNFVMVQHFKDNSSLVWSISVGPTDGALTPTGSLVVGRWDHFAGTYDGTTNRIYQNGELVAEQAHIAGGPVGTGGDLFIGFWPSAWGFAGVIDEVRIWNAVRTEAEIEAWMSRPLTGSEPDLLGYWRLNEGSGQVIADATSFDNGGVLGATTAVEPEDPQWTEPVPYLAFFFDGFESGEPSAWSVAVP